jgi:ketosteroid isomerase-like protein
MLSSAGKSFLDFQENEMRVRIAILMCVFFVSSMAVAKTKTATTAAPIPPNYKAMIQAEYDLWSTEDPTKVAPMFAKDADLIFFDITPLKYNGWAEYEKGVMVVFADYQSMKATVNDDAHGGRSGNLAWTAATVSIHGVKKDGSVDDFTMRTTEVLEKRGGKWIIIHEHASVPMK